MKKFLVVICSAVLAFGLAGCIGKGKAPVGKGKAPVVQTKGQCSLIRFSERPPRGGLSVSSQVHSSNVRYWHKADLGLCTAHVRFWG